MQKITPFLWFDDQAEEAMHHYVDLQELEGWKRHALCDATPGPEGSVMTASFELADALPQYTELSPAEALPE